MDERSPDEMAIENQEAPNVKVPCTCGESIIFPLTAMLSGAGGTCWNCGARLSVDVAANAESFDVIRRLVDRAGELRDHVR